MKKIKVAVASLMTAASVVTAFVATSAVNKENSSIERAGVYNEKVNEDNMVVKNSYYYEDKFVIESQKKMDSSLLNEFDLTSLSKKKTVVNFMFKVDVNTNELTFTAYTESGETIFSNVEGYAILDFADVNKTIIVIDDNIFSIDTLSDYSDYEMCGLWKKIKKAAKKVVNVVKKTAKEAFSEVKDLTIKAKNKIKSKASDLASACKKGAKSAVSAAKELAAEIEEQVEELVDEVKLYAAEAVEFTADTIEVISSLKKEMNDLFEYCAQKVWEETKELAKDAWEKVKNEILTNEEIGIAVHKSLNVLMAGISLIDNDDANGIDIAMITVNLAENRKLESPNDYIDNQNNAYWKKWKFLTSNLNAAGCEVISCFNLCRAMKKDIRLQSVIEKFSLNNIPFEFALGHFGSNPFQFYAFFDSVDISNYSLCADYSDAKSVINNKKAKYLTISYWNTVSLGDEDGLQGFHTVFADLTTGIVYNNTGDEDASGGESFSTISDLTYGRASDKFICCNFIK